MVADSAMTIPEVVYLLLLHADSKTSIIIVHGEVPIHRDLKVRQQEVRRLEIIVIQIAHLLTVATMKVPRDPEALIRQLRREVVVLMMGVAAEVVLQVQLDLPQEEVGVDQGINFQKKSILCLSKF